MVLHSHWVAFHSVPDKHTTDMMVHFGDRLLYLAAQELNEFVNSGLDAHMEPDQGYKETLSNTVTAHQWNHFRRGTIYVSNATYMI